MNLFDFWKEIHRLGLGLRNRWKIQPQGIHNKTELHVLANKMVTGEKLFLAMKIGCKLS
jgi:hypothetical protein